MTALLKYDAACRAVAEAKTIDEVRTWIDKAAAVREYARRIRDRTMELDALEIRANAKRRRGELIRELKADGHFPEGRRTTVGRDPQFTPMRLEDYDISREESSEEQEIAEMPADAYMRLLARCRSYAESHPEKHSINVLKPPPDGEVNGARSIMGSRQEPDDSLDYFPTPPWATRALIERVLPAHNIAMRGGIREPACGEGHIAEVLREYCRDVFASDIFDYGYGGEVVDYLKTDLNFGSDWVVTNPPFGDAALEFVDLALMQARIGVAMFFRSQWAVEGLERFNRIFSRRPPTICAFFVERVNLCKGRWDPDGSTATAYCWLVWHHGARPCPTFWIPPGCREKLTRPDDAERFTAHPVIKKVHTGEVVEFESEEQCDATTLESQSPAPSSDELRSSVKADCTQSVGAGLDAIADRRPTYSDDLEIPGFLRRAAIA